MICPRPDCPIAFRAQASDSYIRESEKKNGHKFSAYMETCEPCALCSPNRAVCWERIVHVAKDGTRTVELRLKRGGGQHAA